MGSIFHNRLAEDGYTRFWLLIAPLLILPLTGVLVLGWLELRQIRKKI